MEPVIVVGGARVFHGDCRDVLRFLPDNSVDSIVTDPPYELSGDGKASPGRVFAKVVFPEDAKFVSETSSDGEFAFLVDKILSLRGIGSFPAPSSSVPVGSVTFDNEALARDDDVEDGDIGAVGVSDGNALIDGITDSPEHLGSFQFKLADTTELLNILGEIGCGFEAGGIGVGLRVSSPGLPSFLHSCASVISGGDDVRLFDDTFAHLVGTFEAASRRSVFRLGDLSGGSAESFTTDGALILLAVGELAGAKLVRASAGASGLSSMLKPCRISVVEHTTGRALTFDLLIHETSLSSVGFMGKEWDGSKIAYNVDVWRECLRVLKPGGHILAFGGSRTFHRLGVAIEDAGFEIRDTIAWISSKTFPKSLNVEKAMDKAGMDGSMASGWGTGLKQVVEPVVLGRKPLDGTVAENTLAWGVGGLNIDGSRIPGRVQKGAANNFVFTPGGEVDDGYVKGTGAQFHNDGRWPANVILDEASAQIIDEQSGENPSRFFYQAKASKRDRNEGLEELEDKRVGSFTGNVSHTPGNKIGANPEKPNLPGKNTHPTVKPTALMRYLIKLVTPPGGTVLDPFTGSGSTGKAALLDGFQFVGIELTDDYLPIIEGRLRWASEQGDDDERLF